MKRRMRIDGAPWMTTRRDWLQKVTVLGGGVLIGGAFTGIGCSTTEPAPESDTATAEAPAAAAVDDALTAQRAQMAAAPMEMMELGAGLVLLSGPGGNVVVLHGTDGKIVADTFVLPAWSELKTRLDALGTAPISTVINTHWHFDHSDNNESFRQAGAGIVAHENTAERLSQSHELLGMQIAPAPEAARPTETFAATHTIEANGETIELAYIQPAHTDTDISIQYAKANVVHGGDVFFNGIYPFIDAGTGGNINGMIAGAERLLTIGDASTRYVPGHGPLADRAALTRYRDVLASTRDRVQKLKSGGSSLEEVQAARPTAEFDATWGMGFMMPNDFVALVYNTL